MAEAATPRTAMWRFLDGSPASSLPTARNRASQIVLTDLLFRDERKTGDAGEWP